jgi:hypothetical protein
MHHVQNKLERILRIVNAALCHKISFAFAFALFYNILQGSFAGFPACISLKDLPRFKKAY